GLPLTINVGHCRMVQTVNASPDAAPAIPPASVHDATGDFVAPAACSTRSSNAGANAVAPRTRLALLSAIAASRSSRRSKTAITPVTPALLRAAPYRAGAAWAPPSAPRDCGHSAG